MARRYAIPALCIASAALLVLASTGALAGAQPAAGTVQLDESIVSVERGDSASLRLTLEDARQATVVVGGPDVGYNVTIEVVDVDGDGTVPLTFDTGSVGMEATRFSVANDVDDYATPNAAPDPDGTVSPGDYPISVYAGHGVGGEPTDVGTLVVNEAPPPTNATIERDGSALTLLPEDSQVVRGTADLDAGRNVTVRLRSSDGTPFLKTRTVPVGEDGGYEATFDLGGVEAPTNATATVAVDGREITGPAEVEVVSRETSSSGQPGFGVVLTAVSVLGGTLVVRRYAE